MSKQFFFFFNCKQEENYSQLIVIKNLNNLIKYLCLCNLNFKNNDNVSDENYFSITIVNVNLYLNDDGLSEKNLNEKRDEDNTHFIFE